MSNLVLTLAFAFLFVIIALCLLGLSYLLTGKSTYKLGTCGRDPTKQKDTKSGCETGSICTMCGKTDKDR